MQWTPQTLNNQGWVPLPFGPAWVFVNLNSNKVLDVAGGSTANGAAVIQQGWSGAASQVWFLVNFGTTHKVFVNFNSGKAMDVAGASITDGAPVIQDWMGSTNQIWSGVPVGMPTSSTTSTTAVSTTTTVPATTTTAPTTSTTVPSSTTTSTTTGSP